MAELGKTTGAHPQRHRNPYIAAGVLVDYLIWGRYPINLKHAQFLTPENMSALTSRDLPTGQ
jgi:hypothetical protein